MYSGHAHEPFHSLFLADRVVRSTLALYPHSRSANTIQHFAGSQETPTIFDAPVHCGMRDATTPSVTKTTITTGSEEHVTICDASLSVSEFKMQNDSTRSTSCAAAPQPSLEDAEVQTNWTVANLKAQVSSVSKKNFGKLKQYFTDPIHFLVYPKVPEYLVSSIHLTIQKFASVIDERI